MKRKYESRLRTEDKVRTRESIVQAAIRLHAQGVTAFSAVAEEAGVSLSTVQKHFPTREDLFQACIAHSAQLSEPPSIEALAAIHDPGERIVEIVRQLYKAHEIFFGYSWTSYKLEDESETLARLIAQVDGLIGAAVDVMLREWGTERPPAEVEAMGGFARGLLSPLTYRALRLKGGLEPKQAVQQTALALSKMLGIGLTNE